MERLVTPIQIILQANNGGHDCLLNLFPEQGSYNPRLTGVQTPPGPTEKSVKGVFQRNPEDGLVTDRRAYFTFPCDAEIENLRSNSSEALILNVNYLVKGVRRRYYRAAFDGYTLELEKGSGS